MRLTRCAYHLLALDGPKELVLISVNGKIKDGPRKYSRHSCVGINASADVNNMADFTRKLSNIPPKFLRDLLSPEDMLLNDLKDDCIFFFNYLFSGQMSKNSGLLLVHSSSISIRCLREPFTDDILNI